MARATCWGRAACRDMELPGWVRLAVEAPSPPCRVHLEGGARGEVRCSSLEGDSQQGLTVLAQGRECWFSVALLSSALPWAGEI